MARIVKKQPFPHFETYQEYKGHLRRDFQHCCVYCSIHENEWGGLRHFQVEHFKPKSRFPELITQYENLLYACDVCNAFKGYDWPVANPDGNGYLDPCEYDYDEYFRISPVDWHIEGLTRPASYMVERLHLNRKHLVKLRQIRTRENEIHQRFDQLSNSVIERIDDLLSLPDLAGDVIETLEMSKKVILLLHEEHNRSWNHRWTPLYDPEDLR